MQRILVPLLAFIVGTAAGVGIHRVGAIDRLNALQGFEQPRRKFSSPPSSPSATQADRRTRAWGMLSKGHFREAQDEFLEILQFDPLQQDAMRGLVTVRHRMAHNDPVVLRRQAQVYRDAIRHRVETQEHYTVTAMLSLAAASQQAADEIEMQKKPGARILGAQAESGGLPDNAARLPANESRTGKPLLLPQDAKRTPKSPKTALSPSPIARAKDFGPKPQASAEAPKGTRPLPLTTSVGSSQKPSPTINDPLYMMEISPLSDAKRAADVAEQLVRAGFLPATDSHQTGPLRFRVVSEALPRTIAEHLIAVLAEREIRGQLQSPGGDLTQVEFGVFNSQEEANALAQAIRSQGHNAKVVQEGVTYVIHLGPHPLSSVNAIVKIVKSSAPESTVKVDPVP